ncbi:hypothetical protein C0991_007743 [Blastosporella zonata]|nr:hypothetical protein C0991_007743 [Blastosporella zonata]
MASPSNTTSTDIEVTPESPRIQAESLPLKAGEIGYVEGAMDGVRSPSPEVNLPARHPADRDNSISLDPPIPSAPSTALGSPSTSTLVSSESNNSTSKRSKVLCFFKTKKIPAVLGLRLTTLVIFFVQLVAIGATIAGWAILVRTAARNTPDGFNTTAIFIHVVFSIAVLAQLVMLERRLFRLRAERFTYLHPGQILPSSRIGRLGEPGIAFSPWNRPPLPTYAAALAQSGVGTGDVEDHLIAAPPPPAYGNTRGSTLLLSGFLRNSLRAQRPSSGQSRPMSVHSEMGHRDERPVSYISRDEEWEARQDAERARQLEETLTRLERPLSRSSP